jgi:nucleosome binding factor SPN SPT16 subunit
LFGYDIPDTCFLLRKDGNVWYLSNKKKASFLQPAVDNSPKGSSIQAIHLLVRNKDDDNAANYETLLKEAGASKNDATCKVGVIAKEREANKGAEGNIGPLEARLTEAAEQPDGTLELVDIAPGLTFCMSVKDDAELDLMKKSSILSNKVMKYGFIKKMEEIFDSEQRITHEALAAYVEDILEDPSKISIKVLKEDVQSCYYPSIHSGGVYDVRVSSTSNSNALSSDVITVSFGARYHNVRKRLYASV